MTWVRLYASVPVLVVLALVAPTLVAADASRSSLCKFGVPEGPNSYIIDCLTADKCNLLAKSLGSIVGDSFDVLRSLALLTGNFDSSIIRLLCANSGLGSLVGGIELDGAYSLTRSPAHSLTRPLALRSHARRRLPGRDRQNVTTRRPTRFLLLPHFLPFVTNQPINSSDFS